jgi:hypothetical protein
MSVVGTSRHSRQRSIPVAFGAKRASAEPRPRPCTHKSSDSRERNLMMRNSLVISVEHQITHSNGCLEVSDGGLSRLRGRYRLKFST